MEIKAGQTWRIKGSTRPPVIVVRASPYTRKVSWHYEGEEKRIYDSPIDVFEKDNELVKDI